MKYMIVFLMAINFALAKDTQCMSHINSIEAQSFEINEHLKEENKIRNLMVTQNHRMKATLLKLNSEVVSEEYLNSYKNHYDQSIGSFSSIVNKYFNEEKKFEEDRLLLPYYYECSARLVKDEKVCAQEFTDFTKNLDELLKRQASIYNNHFKFLGLHQQTLSAVINSYNTKTLLEDDVVIEMVRGFESNLINYSNEYRDMIYYYEVQKTYENAATQLRTCFMNYLKN